MTEPAGYVELSDFWAQFFEMTARGAPPPRQPEALEAYARTVFGDLAEHRVRPLDALPFRIDCTGCRNNTGGPPRAAVCQTHIGVLKGVLQAMTHVPLELAYAPGADGACTITAQLPRTSDGRQMRAFARRLPSAEPYADTAGCWVRDERVGQLLPVPPAVHSVLSLLDRERDPAELERTTGLPDAQVRAILDQCYAFNWIQCRFAEAPAEAPAEAGA